MLLAATDVLCDDSAARTPAAAPLVLNRPPAGRKRTPRRRSGRRSVLAALALAGFFILPQAGRAEPLVTVANAWFRYMLPELPAGGYMTLSNHSSQPMVLKGASSAACGMLMLHRSEESGGVERMVPAGTITVPPHGTFRFAPGGYHVMCMHPLMHIGERVTVTLRFADGAQIPVPFTVYGVNGPTTSAPHGAAQGAPMKMPM